MLESSQWIIIEVHLGDVALNLVGVTGDSPVNNLRMHLCIELGWYHGLSSLADERPFLLELNLNLYRKRRGKNA